MVLLRLPDMVGLIALLMIAASTSALGQRGRSDLPICLSNQSSSDKRIESCTRLIQSNRLAGRQLAVVFDARGMAFNNNHDFAHAIADFTEAIKIDSTFAASLYLRGVAYENQIKLELALADLTEAQRLAPDDRDISAAISRIRLVLATLAGHGSSSASAAMGVTEIKALQQRLADAGCYRGTIDGQRTPALEAAVKACPTQAPMLRIETGTHVAQVRAISADPQCRILATNSMDKTTRIWSATDRHLLRTLRSPIDDANGGVGFAVAVSPDGRYVATAGWDAQQDVSSQSFIYVFDASTGALAARPFGFADAIQALAFSPDGRWLAASGGSLESGVRVYDTANWRVVMSDLSYHQRLLQALSFGPDGSLYTAGLDGQLRRYGPGPDFRNEREVAARGGRQPSSISADPRGEFVAVGFFDSPTVSIFDASTLRYRSAAHPSGGSGTLETVAWSRDGEHLFAGGSYSIERQGYWTVPLLIFDRNGRQSGETAKDNDNSISSIAACGSGMAVASGSRLGVLDQAGALQWLGSAAIDMRDKVSNHFTVSADAKQIRFGLGFAQTTSPANSSIVDPVAFDLTRGTLNPAPNSMPGLFAPSTNTLPVDRWSNDDNPTFAGYPLALRTGETARSLAIRSDRSGFVLGTTIELRAYRANGTEVWEVPAAAQAWGVNLSADGRIIVAACGDGTIRWLRWSDGKELLALFVDKADKRWVAWTPSGYYMASPGGEDLIGWHVNRGWNQAADFFSASRFRDRFNRPDIVRLVLDTLDEDAAIKQSNAFAKRREDTQPLIGHLPPVISIVGPADGAIVTANKLALDYTVRSPSGQPVDRLDLVINGRPVKSIGLPINPLAPDAESKGSVQVTLTQHLSEVGLIAWSGGLSSQAAQVKVIWNGAPEVTRKLYALVVGVSDYADPEMALKYAAKDAGDFAKALQDQKGGYYADVQTRVLTDRAVTRAGLIQGLQWLEQSATNPNDVSVLYLAGHGMTDEQQTYWYYTADANDSNIRINGVSQDEIRKSLQRLQGKVLWFLDTCHAGTAAKRPPVDMNVLVNTVSASENGGIVVFASSTGRQVSVETADLGNGAFTKAVVEGIDLGKAALGSGFITTSTLDSYVVERVEEFTGERQTPVMERPPEEPDFAIAEVKK